MSYAEFDYEANDSYTELGSHWNVLAQLVGGKDAYHRQTHESRCANFFFYKR